MTAVAYKHPKFLDNIELWETLDDVCRGQEAVKRKRERYLPRHNKLDQSPEAKAYYDSYLHRAVFYGVTKTTLSSLIGAAFATDPSFKFPVELDHLNRNANGAGLSIFQLAQASLRHIMKHYRCALYVDFPTVTPSKSVADDKNKNAYPMIHLLSAKAVINWDSIMINNQRKLSLVVIQEVLSERGQDGFELIERVQYRVLRLEDAGHGDYVYTVEVISQTEKNAFASLGKAIPTDYNGQYWDYIPFTFVGAIDNSDEIDTAPLLDLANLNLAHYRDSADFQESVYYMGQPQYYSSGVSWSWYDEAKKRGIYIGAKTIIPLPENGKIGIAQVNANTLAREAMSDKWAQMKELGARLVEPGSASRKTATQSDNDDAVQHSVLSLCAVNISEALNNALGWCAKYAMPDPDQLTNDELNFEISQEFSKQGYLDSLAKQLYEGALQGRNSFKSWWEYNQTGMFPKQTYEEELEAIEAENSGVILRQAEQ
ncbi:MAG: DUF4055 domain-containing protein [Acinetobacter sp.]